MKAATSGVGREVAASYARLQSVLGDAGTIDHHTLKAW
jgi:hypothetical protein